MTLQTRIPKVFILTLKGNNRSEKLQSILFENKVDYEIVYGIDGRIGLSPEHEASIDRDETKKVFGRRMSDGEYACALSHRLIYKKIIDQDLDRAIVFEDDTIPHMDFFSLSRYFFEATELTLLYHHNAYVWRSSLKKQPYKGVFTLSNSPFGACAYVISANIARLIISRANPITSPADWPIDLTKINSGAAWPLMAIHEGTSTSNLSYDRLKSSNRAITLKRIIRRVWKLIGKKIT